MFLMLPVGDDNPKERTPYVNYAILAVNLLFFLIAGPEPSDAAIRILALHPEEFSPVQMFTSMFLHLGWMHFLGNMLFLWIFGDNVEDRLGHLGYATFYLGWGALAAIAHMAATSMPELPMMGASGAISGVIGAYVVFFPERKIRLFFWFVIIIRIIEVRSVYWIGFWFLDQILLAAFGTGGGVAYGAHIGGFVAGAVTAGIVRVLVAPAPRTGAIPAGLANASRRGIGGAAAHPVPVSPSDVVFVNEPDMTYAVLRTGNGGGYPPQVVQLIAAGTGEPVNDVWHRLKTTRGMIARNIDHGTAEYIVKGLRQASIDAISVADVASNRPPVPVSAASLTWGPGGLGVTIGSDGRQVPWSSPSLVAAARCEGVPMIEMIAPEFGRVRIGPDTPMGETDPATGRLVNSTLDRFADAVLHRRTAAWLNEGVRVLANRGQWGWLDFPTEAEYEDYLFWIYNLIRQGARDAVRRV